MAETASPRTVVENLLKGITNRSRTELSALYAEDVVVEHPFNVPEPTRINGRAELHERFTQASDRPFEMSVHNVVIRETDDPEVVVVEYDYLITITTTGQTLETANILVVRVRDGLIVHSVDYHNHHRLHAALDAVMASQGQGQGQG
jgi:ketosteroid isomerase-like protein